MVWRRTTEAAAAKAPTPKTVKRRIFSRRGRWTDESVLAGRTRIQMSVTMLKPEVARKTKRCQRGRGRQGQASGVQ